MRIQRFGRVRNHSSRDIFSSAYLPDSVVSASFCSKEFTTRKLWPFVARRKEGGTRAAGECVVAELVRVLVCSGRSAMPMLSGVGMRVNCGAASDPTCHGNAVAIAPELVGELTH